MAEMPPFDPAQPERLKVAGQNSSFVFKPHQVVDAGTLVQLCKTPIHGGLLANETGTGKTATYLLALVMQQLEKERVHATGTPVVFKPAMLVVPAATIAQVFNEIHTVTGDSFQVGVYYSYPEAIKDQSEKRLRDATFRPHQFQRWCDDVTKESALLRPSNGRRLLLTSYTTATRRMLELYQEQKEDAVAAAAGNNNGEEVEAEAEQAANANSGANDNANDNADDNADANANGEAEEDETEEKVWYEKGKLREPLSKVAFGTIIFDECQYVRRPLSTYGWLARLLQAEGKILASATPFLNIIQDIRGALTILTEHAKIGFQVPSIGNAAKRLYEDDFNPETEELEHLGFLAGPGLIAKFPGMTEVIDAWRADGKRYWQAQSQVLMTRGQNMAWSTEFLTTAVHKALRLIQLRRSMHTPLILPDGSTTTPGDDLPAFAIRTHVLQHHNELTDMVQKLTDNLLARTRFRRSRRRRADGEATAKKPTAILDRRAAALVAFNACAAYMVQNRRGNKAILGVPDMEELRQAGPAGALSTIMYETNTGAAAMMMPTGRAEMATFAMRFSPVLAKVVQLAIEAVQAKERILIMVDQIWAQEVIAQTLTELGLDVESVRASHKPTERRLAVGRFNDPTAEVSAYVTSMNLSSFGLNLQKCCSRGVLAQFSYSFNTFEQCLGRLVRIGQNSNVTWSILKQDASYSCLQEERLYEKWAKQLLAALTLPEHLSDTSAEVVVYEVMRLHWGAPFNRYAWRLDVPHTAADYEDEKMGRLGAMLSRVALGLLDADNGPGLAELVNTRPSALLALATELEAEDATVEAIVGALLAAQDEGGVGELAEAMRQQTLEPSPSENESESESEPETEDDDDEDDGDDGDEDGGAEGERGQEPTRAQKRRPSQSPDEIPSPARGAKGGRKRRTKRSKATVIEDSQEDDAAAM
ncbi:snf2 family helicase [Grosmannia clavigera kw1407]|uniref:Snf2 family helicase n=1 Tax=Grosmannia clavigera (strain kw1407 / UAMH 11150) TaxID=655863 RepID=F0XL62_GROCL|nr:snf2 family helicase [Grosmannia clavigera kw1407]EFX01739.1 snf2 family helicase [Grosmannia clavigera kw1407]